MKKPDYLHEDSLATAVLSDTWATRGTQERPSAPVHEIGARNSANSDRNIDPVHNQAEGETDWLQLVKSVTDRTLQLEEWYSEWALWGHDALRNSVEIDPGRRGGIPVLKGTRFTVGQTLSELADSSGVSEVAAQFDLDEKVIRKLLYGLALLADKPRP
jgi:uncharacterized protein (DUF433 family)